MEIDTSIGFGFDIIPQHWSESKSLHPFSFHDTTVPNQRPLNVMLTDDDMGIVSKSDQTSWSRNVSKPRD